MKKFTIFILATCFILAVIPTQLKAAKNVVSAKTAITSTDATISNDQLNEIKTIDLSALSSTENKEALKVKSPLANEPLRQNGKLITRRDRDLDLSIKSPRTNHSGIYLGAGGIIILIIILLLVL